MGVVKIRSTVKSDGSVTVPVGVDEAGLEVEVIVTPLRRKRASDMTQEQWEDLVTRTAGTIEDPSFVRPPQPPMDPIPGFD